MSTRSATIIRLTYDTSDALHLYRHSDGYPACAGQAILDALDGAECPEQVAGKLLSMTYDGERGMRLKAIYHPTDNAANHGDLEHVYEVFYADGWRVKHAARQGWQDNDEDFRRWPTSNMSHAEFADYVAQEQTEMQRRIDAYRARQSA